MTVVENHEVKVSRLLAFPQRLGYAKSVLEEAGTLEDAGELDRALSRYTAAIGVFLWFERRKDSEDMPLRSAILLLETPEREAAEHLVAAAMLGAGRCLLATGSADAVVYAASTALRLGGREHEARVLRAKGHLLQGTARGLEVAVADLRRVQAAGDRGGGAVGRVDLDEVCALLQGAESELASARTTERQMAKRMLGLHGDHGPASRGAGDAVDRAGPSDATIAGVLGSEAPFSPGATSSVPWVAPSQDSAGSGPGEGDFRAGQSSPGGDGGRPRLEGSALRQRASWTESRGSAAHDGEGTGVPKTPRNDLGTLRTVESDADDGQRRLRAQRVLLSQLPRTIGGLSISDIDPDVLQVARSLDLDLSDPMVLAELDVLSRVERHAKQAGAVGEERPGGDHSPHRRIRRVPSKRTGQHDAFPWLFMLGDFRHGVTYFTRLAYAFLVVFFAWRIYHLLTAPLATSPAAGDGFGAQSTRSAPPPLASERTEL